MRRSRTAALRRGKIIILGFCLVFSLSACGFEPLHGVKSAQVSPRPAIEIASIPDREGHLLRNRLIDRLGQPDVAGWQLKISPLEKNIVHLGIRKDATATRAQVQMAALMQLVEKSTGRVMVQRRLNAVGAYNLLDNQLATIVSQQTVVESMLQAMAEDAVTEIDLYLRRVQDQ